MARKGAFDPSLIVTRVSPLARKEGFTALPKGAAGALAQGLRAAVRDGLRDIAPDLIDARGAADRLGELDEDDRALRDSLKRHGQLVPVLLRPSVEAPGRYEIIYGRRRVRAAQALGMPVKAIIRALDGEEAVVAQGQENTARRDLSFIERARFARLILEDGYSRDVAIEALHCHATVLSVMLGVASDVPDQVILAIGPAPSIGRDRWFGLAKFLRVSPLPEAEMLAFLARPEIAAQRSDARFLAFSAFVEAAAAPKPSAAEEEAAAKAAGQSARDLHDPATRRALGRVERNARFVTIKIAALHQPGFARWLDERAEALIGELRARYRDETGWEN
jgi:ParB family chromosome partitioning protein